MSVMIQHPVHRIELRLQEVAQLFNSMDPTPFHHKDLDRDAEEFIESWALEFPQDSRFHITVHLGQMPPEDPTALVAEAIHNYFDYKSELARRAVRVLLLEGRTSLLIGIGFLALVPARRGSAVRVRDRDLPQDPAREPHHRRLGRDVAADADFSV